VVKTRRNKHGAHWFCRTASMKYGRGGIFPFSRLRLATHRFRRELFVHYERRRCSGSAGRQHRSNAVGGLHSRI